MCLLIIYITVFRFELECEAVGNPIPSIQWLLNGVQVRINVRKYQEQGMHVAKIIKVRQWSTDIEDYCAGCMASINSPVLALLLET